MSQANLPFYDVSSKLPAEEQDAIRNLPIAEIPEWARAREEEYKRRIKELEKHIAMFRALQNTGAPISRLPNEVLGAIFAAGACGLHEEQIPRLSVGSVCRRWKDVLLSTAIFWANWIGSAIPDTSLNAKCLSFAIRHSGAIPLSLHIRNPGSDLFSVLSDYPGRIFQLKLHDVEPRAAAALEKLVTSGCMWSLHSAHINTPKYRDFTLDCPDALPTLRFLRLCNVCLTPQTVVGSLETLELARVDLDLGEFHKVLERCPRLQVLIMYDLYIQDSKTDNATGYCGPSIALQKLSINDWCPNRLSRLLSYFSTSIGAQLIVLVHVGFSSSSVSSPDFSPWDSQPGGIVGPPCIFDRLCLRDSHHRIHWHDWSLSGYAGLTERLHTSTFRRNTYYLNRDDLLPRPFRVPTISVLVLDRQSAYGTNQLRYERLIEVLPHVRRIELPYRAVEAISFSASFLREHANIASALSIAWVLGVERGEEGRAGAAAELEGLLSLLRQHMDSGKPRLGRLELYVMRSCPGFKRKPYAGRIDENTDAALCREVVAPFLSRLEEVADAVILG